MNLPRRRPARAAPRGGNGSSPLHTQSDNYYDGTDAKDSRMDALDGLLCVHMAGPADGARRF